MLSMNYGRVGIISDSLKYDFFKKRHHGKILVQTKGLNYVQEKTINFEIILLEILFYSVLRGPVNIFSASMVK